MTVYHETQAKRRLRWAVNESLAKSKKAGAGAVDATENLLDDLERAGWRLMPPPDDSTCQRCRQYVEPGTTHTPFNGNQMFACHVVSGGSTIPATKNWGMTPANRLNQG